MITRVIFLAWLACLSFSAFSEAPLVDDRENFALFDEQRADEQPVARESQRQLSYNEEQPLVKDDTNTIGTNDANLINKIQGLQQDLQELRGQLEIQAHQLKLLQEQQLSFYKDIDTRLSQPSSSKALKDATPSQNLSITTAPEKHLSSSATTPDDAVSSTAKPSSTPTTNINPQPIAPLGRTDPADEQISYLAAFEHVKNKRYDEAIQSMQTFITRYPHGGYTANAHYWLGELFMVKKEYSNALEHFDIVLHDYPSSSKCSASMLKVGYALAATGQTDAAKIKLHDVMKHYPDTHAAQLASAKLASLGG